jgi:hypothetical protein
MLVVLAGVTALAASSQAVIVITPLDASVTNPIQNEADITPVQLSNGAFGLGTVTDTGGFTISSTTGLTQLVVDEVSAQVFTTGILSLTVLLDGTTTLYSDISITDNPLKLSQVTNLPGLTGTHTVTYTASFLGTDPGSVGYLGGFSVDGFEAVPEPLPYATLGIGILGLMARKRRSGK